MEHSLCVWDNKVHLSSTTGSLYLVSIYSTVIHFLVLFTVWLYTYSIICTAHQKYKECLALPSLHCYLQYFIQTLKQLSTGKTLCMELAYYCSINAYCTLQMLFQTRKGEHTDTPTKQWFLAVNLRRVLYLLFGNCMATDFPHYARKQMTHNITHGDLFS